LFYTQNNLVIDLEAGPVNKLLTINLIYQSPEGFIKTFKYNYMSVVKVLELMSSSTKSWEDATQQAVNEASKSLKHIRSVYIQDHSAIVKNNKIVEYRITAKLSFEIEHASESKPKK